MAELLDLAAGDDGDLAEMVDGDLAHVEDGDALAQIIQLRLETPTDSWFLDTSVYVDYRRRVFIKGVSLAEVTSELRGAILGAPFVRDIKRLDLNFDRPARRLQVAFVARSRFREVGATATVA